MKPFEDHYSGVGSQSFGGSMEKLMTGQVNDGAEIPLEELGPNIMDNVMEMAERNQMGTPGNSGMFSSSQLKHITFTPSL